MEFPAAWGGSWLCALLNTYVYQSSNNALPDVYKIVILIALLENLI
jgi:hypothetical protein